MKTCVNCEIPKDEKEFAFRNKIAGTRHNRCKLCQSAYCKQHYKRNKPTHNKARYIRIQKRRRLLRKLIWQYLLINPCVDCGENNPTVLDFDHVKGKKIIEVSRMVSQGYSWEKIKKEIAKCEVRCANCHRKKTAKEAGWYNGE